MTFAEALKAGQTEYGEPDKVVTTHISNVFIFGNKVVKVYKHQKHFFADLETFESRKAFYEEDFFWNNTASPEIYLHLWGVAQEEDIFSLVPVGLGTDFAIEMSKIDDSNTLTKVLINQRLTPEQAEGFIDALVDTLGILTKERRQRLDHLFQNGLYKIMLDNTTSLYDWMTGEQKVPAEWPLNVREILNHGLEVVPYFKDVKSDALSAAFDNNTDNLLLLDGRPSFIDILSPMEIWRVVDEYATISRTIVDLEVMQNMEIGNIAREAYKKYGRNIPKAAMLMHELRAAAIQWPYRYMIGQDELAIKFGEYTKQKYEELVSEIGNK